MLRTIKIQRFKRFPDVEVHLRPFSIFMGENGSGKTTILQAIGLALRALNSTDLVEVNDADQTVKIRQRGIAFAQLPGLDVESPSDLFYARDTHGGGSRAIDLTLTDTDGSVYALRVTTRFGQYNVKCISEAGDIKPPAQLTEQKPLFISGFVGLQAGEERLFPVAIQDRLDRGRASEILRNLLLELKETDEGRFDRFRSKVLRNFGFDLGTVQFEGQRDLYVHASYREDLPITTASAKSKTRRVALDLATAGSGFLQVLQILAPIYRYAASTSIALLDEPDAHLHPDLQRTLARVLREVAEEEELQILIATHSAAIIREAEPETIVPVSSQKSELRGLSSADDVELEIVSRLDNFTTGKAKIAGRLVFVEDKNTKVLTRLDDLLCLGIASGPEGVPVLSAQGKDDRVPYTIRKVLERLTEEPIKVLILRDSDGVGQKERQALEKYAIECGVGLVIFPYHEIESILISPAVITQALREKNIDATEEEVSTICVECMKAVVTHNIYNFQGTLTDNIHKASRVADGKADFGVASKRAIELLRRYAAFSTLDELRRVAPAKEALGLIRQRLKDKYKIQITNATLLRSLKREHVPDEIVEALQQLAGHNEKRWRKE